ncbi:MAG: glycosyl transferase [Moraxellaceae bacterium]|nr:MAG: glycosyl transferase [Moraxellaceae bacterium]
MKLSICIPTYNRVKYLESTISEIIKQIGDKKDIEIIISDNASTDNTKEIVEMYQYKYNYIIYHCAETNMGADYNYLKVIELATGDFCWFMGSDDIILNNSLNNILKYIDKYPDVAGITVNYEGYNISFDKKIKVRPPVKYNKNKLYDNSEICFSELGHFFGYISAQIVNRIIWNEALKNSNYKQYMNAYVHLYIIGQMLTISSRWLYVNDKSVGWRSGNDSFLSSGRYNRLKIDVFEYERIASDIFSKNSKTYLSVLTNVCKSYVFSQILSAKVDNIPSSFFLKAFVICFKIYWRIPIFWLKIVPILITPSIILRLIRTIKLKTINTFMVTN